MHCKKNVVPVMAFKKTAMQKTPLHKKTNCNTKLCIAKDPCLIGMPLKTLHCQTLHAKALCLIWFFLGLGNIQIPYEGWDKFFGGWLANKEIQKINELKNEVNLIRQMWNT